MIVASADESYLVSMDGLALQTYCSCVLKLTNPPQQGEHRETNVQGFVRTIDMTSVELLKN